jgi:hypothetical protein
MGRIRQSWRQRRGAAAAALIGLTVATLGAGTPVSAVASTGGASEPFGAVRGDVVSVLGAPVPNARVSIPEDRQVTTSDADGSFAFAGPVRTAWPYRRMTVVVTAPGWGRWELSGAPLYPGDQLIVHAELKRTPFVDNVQTPAERAATAASAAGHVQPSAVRGAPAPSAAFDHGASATDPASAGDGTVQPTPRTSPGIAPVRRTSAGVGHGGQIGSGHTCTGWNYQLVPPPTIWVYRIGTGVSEQYDFVFYATHVLPNEWISAWDADALGAGAIAVRTYAAWRTMPDHAYSEGPNCGDVRDTVDGLFDPSWTTASASQAVYAAWGSIVYQNGGLFVAHYFAGPRDNPCAHVDEGQFTGWMSQWGTQNCAIDHEVWPDIVDTFYDSDATPTSWHYARNLLLNPSISAGALYAFRAKRASFTREEGTGADGTWYLQLDPKAGKRGTLSQHRAFLGKADTPYHDGASLRCPVATGAPCEVTLRVTVYAVEAKKGEARAKVFMVPNDGVWHAYSFDPASFGIDHEFVRSEILSTADIGVDKVLLTAPYGGP